MTPAPKLAKAADRMRVVLLVNRVNKFNITGDMSYISMLAPTIGRFANHIAKDGNGRARLSMSQEDIAKAILDTIERSTKDGCSDRTIITLRQDSKNWLLTIMPIYSVGAGNGN